MASIILSNIPDICVRDDLVQHFKTALSHEELDYVLYPLGKDETKALVAFKSQRAAECILRQPVQIFGATLRTRPAPRQTYQRCTADLDPMIVASIPDLQECIRELQQEFGVDVSFSHEVGSMMLSGSLMQIQCSQTKLDAIFRAQQEAQARELLMVEQDLSTPRSQRSLSVESPDLRQTQELVSRTSVYNQEAGRTQSARMSNTMPAGRLYEQRPHSSHEVRRSKDSTFTSTSRTVDSMFDNSKPYSKSKKAPASKKDHRGLPQGVLHDDSFTVRGVKIQKHLASEDFAGSTMPVGSRQTEFNSSETDRNLLRHTMPTQAWGETFTQPTKNQTSSKSKGSHPMPHMSKSPPARRKAHIPEAREGLKVSKDGKEYLSLTIELDADVMGYIKKIHKPEVKELELKHQVQFSNKWGNEVMDVRIITTDSIEQGGQHRLEQAKEAFVGFYQTVFYSVVKEVVQYDCSKVPETEVDAVTTAVGKAFASRVFVNSRSPGEIILVGSWDYLPLVREWVNKKLVHIIHTNRQHKGITNGTDQPKSVTSVKSSKTKSGKQKRPDKPSHNIWVEPQRQQQQHSQRSELGGSMPVRTSAEGYARASAALDRAFEDSLNSQAEASPTDGLFYEHRIHDDLQVFIYKADITESTQDVIVNASNESLHHIGTIALAISNTAGPLLQQQCTAYVTKNGPLRVSEVMSTPASGHLQCHHVIHAVGPMWCLFTNKEKCAEVLKQTFINTLFYANNKLKATSLAMPAISTGVYGVPLDVCTRAMYDAINTFSRAASSLKEIHVLDLEEEASGMMSVIFQQLSAGDCGQEGQELQVQDPESEVETELKKRAEGGGDDLKLVGGLIDDQVQIEFQQARVTDRIQSNRTDPQYASAPPAGGKQMSADWPDSPPPSPRTRPLLGDEEGPLSPPPSPDEDYEEPISGHPLIQVTRSSEQHSAAPPGIVSPRENLSARSMASHHSEEIVQTVVTPEKFDPSGFPANSPRPASVHSVISSRAESLISETTPRSQTDFLSPRAESVASHHSELLVRTDSRDTKTQPLNLSWNSPRGEGSTHSSRAASMKDGTSPRAEITSPHSVRSPAFSPRSEQMKSGEVTPRSQRSSKAGSVKSGDVTPRSDKVKPHDLSQSGYLKSGEVTPRSVGSKSHDTSKSGSFKSGDRTPRSGVKSHQTSKAGSKAGSVKSGDVTPRSDRFKSPITSPRPEDFHSPRPESVRSRGTLTPKSNVQSPRSGSVKSPAQSPIDDFFKTTTRRDAARSSGQSSRKDSETSTGYSPREGAIQPQKAEDSHAAPVNFSSQPNLIVPNSTTVVECSPKYGSEDSRQSSAMQEPLPEAEFKLLKQVHLSTEKSTIEDVTNRPRVKSPSSSFSEVFDQKEMQNIPLLIRLVASSICIAEKAGEIIRDIMKKGELGIVKKGPNDLQTEADRSAQRSIIGSLHRQFPNVTVIGEEGADENGDDVDPDWIETSQSVEVLQYTREVPDDLRNIDASDVVIWVDPLDGTSEYTEGLLDHVTTLIGISVRGKAVAGIIYQPFYNYLAGPEAQLGRTIWGITGVGAFGLDSVRPPQGENIICTTRSHSNKNVNLSVDSCEPTEVLRVGGSGHKVLLLLEGQAHGYVFASPGTKKWDTCAPEAVLHACGGKLTDMHGYFYQYDAQVQVKNSGGVLAATNEEDHTSYMSKIPKDVLGDLHTDGAPVWQLAEQLTSKLKLVEAPLLIKLVAASVSIAERAGDIIRQIMKQGELGIVEKGINDLQTEADRSAQECIVSSLRKQFTGLTVIGEEDEDLSKEINSDWVDMSQSPAVLEFARQLPEELRNVNIEDVVVWVDPLDGTAEYTQGLLDHVTTLIGLSVKGQAKAGVVYQPFYNYEAGPDATMGRTIWGVVGLGSFGFDIKQPKEGENIICTTRSHSNRNVTLTVESCQPSDVLRVGGSGHKVLLILEGLAHAYVFATPGTKKWDTCAPEAVLCAVGGKMTDMLGNCFQYHANVQKKNNAGVLATPKSVEHEWYVERIPDEVREVLVSEGPAPWQQQVVMSSREGENDGDVTPRY